MGASGARSGGATVALLFPGYLDDLEDFGGARGGDEENNDAAVKQLSSSSSSSSSSASLWRQLYDEEPLFRRHADVALAALAPLIGHQVKDIFRGGECGANGLSSHSVPSWSLLNDPAVAAFAGQYGLAKAMEDVGVTSVAVAARGVGEIASAVTTRSLRLANGARLVAALVARRSDDGGARTARAYVASRGASKTGSSASVQIVSTAVRRERVRVRWRIAARFVLFGATLEMRTPAVPLASETAVGWVGDGALANPAEFWTAHALLQSSSSERDGDFFSGGVAIMSRFCDAAQRLLRWGPDVIVSVGRLGADEGVALARLCGGSNDTTTNEGTPPQDGETRTLGSTKPPSDHKPPLLVSSLGPHRAGWATYEHIVREVAGGGGGGGGSTGYTMGKQSGGGGGGGGGGGYTSSFASRGSYRPELCPGAETRK